VEARKKQVAGVSLAEPPRVRCQWCAERPALQGLRRLLPGGPLAGRICWVCWNAKLPRADVVQ
jgi:hypothetical protein